MAENRIAPQKEYKTQEDFAGGQNNFYLHFLDDCWICNEMYRPTPHFQRFQEQNSELEQEVTRSTVQAMRTEPRQKLPYEKLWEAYKIMSELVFVDDKYVMRDGEPDNWFLCR